MLAHSGRIDWSKAINKRREYQGKKRPGDVNKASDSSIARPSAQGSSGHVSVDFVIRTALDWLLSFVGAQAMAGREMIAASASKGQQQHMFAKAQGDLACLQLSLLQAKQSTQQPQQNSGCQGPGTAARGGG